MASLYIRGTSILAITLVGNIVSKSSPRKSFSSLRSNLLLSIPKIIYTIIARTLLASPYYLAVSDPTLFRIDRVKYLSYLVGSRELRVIANLGVVFVGRYSSSRSSRASSTIA